MADWTVEELARMIDHSLLHPMLDDKQLIRGMALAVECNCASVCIKPYFVGIAAKLLDGTGVRTGTVIGFPHGGNSTAVKIDEAKRAIDDGAEELDMVINIGKARSGEWGYVRDEIAGLNACVTSQGAILKVIFENDFLCDPMIEQLCGICNEIMPAYIKTSTGFGFTEQESGGYDYDGATVPHLALMRRLARPEIGVKAAGKIRTLDTLLAARKLGATRIGTSATERILQEALQRQEK
ncbi:MAG: deoxyribose-phosphate aldolase [Lentisphaeria bacterium]|nr:deoxyribose-phosphate aldolase [Lentisphaeria bacterium]